MLLQLETYKPQWKVEFEQLCYVFSEVLHDIPVTIEHVGSTAIPGMIAKPILDIDIIPEKAETLTVITKQLKQVGYLFKNEQGVKDRFVFKQTNLFIPATNTNKKWMTHHLYVCLSNSLALKNHLLFRDALLKDEELAHKYYQLKTELLAEKGMTRETYNKRKTDFILSVLEMQGLTKSELVEIEKVNK